MPVSHAALQRRAGDCTRQAATVHPHSIDFARMPVTRRLLAVLSALAIAPPLAAQGTSGATGTIPAFAIDSSPLALTGDARAGMFISAVGRRAIAMGSEDGKLEL